MAKKKKTNLKKVKRNFEGPDWYLEQQTVAFHDLYSTDQPDLEAIDPDLDVAFGTSWGTAITTAMGETLASAIRAQLKQKTVTVDAFLKPCLDKYDEVMFYAVKAFGKKSPTLKEFGQGTFHTRASKSKQIMLEFMMALSKAANRLSTELIAKGYTQPKIDEILTLRTTLQNDRSDQYDFKIKRPELTQKRIGEYNALYTIVLQVIAAAKLAYKTNPAKLSEYRYNPPVNHRNKIVIDADAEPGEIVAFDTESSTVHPLSDWLVTLKATGSDFVFYLSTNPGDEPTGTTLPVTDGVAVTKTLAEIKTLLGATPTLEKPTAKNTGTSAGHIQLSITKPKKKK